MTISPAITSLSKPEGDEPISKGKLAYLCARYRAHVHALILEELEKSGLTNAQLARRLRMDAGQLSRLLGSPSNMSLDTACMLLFAIAGKEPDTKALPFGEMDLAPVETVVASQQMPRVVRITLKHGVAYMASGSAVTPYATESISGGAFIWQTQQRSPLRRNSRRFNRQTLGTSTQTALPQTLGLTT